MVCGVLQETYVAHQCCLYKAALQPSRRLTPVRYIHQNVLCDFWYSLKNKPGKKVKGVLPTKTRRPADTAKFKWAEKSSQNSSLDMFTTKAEIFDIVNWIVI